LAGGPVVAVVLLHEDGNSGIRLSALVRLIHHLVAKSGARSRWLRVGVGTPVAVRRSLADGWDASPA
jgi:hypothetical protein